MNGVEKSIARAVAAAIIANGHKISVDFDRGYDCEEKNRDLTDLEKIIAASDEVDECWWMIDAEHLEGTDACATNGWVYFIWGNGEEGRTCVSNYASSLEPLLAPIWPWAEEAECQLVGTPASHKLRMDAKALDTGMDPELVRELHAAADKLDGSDPHAALEGIVREMIYGDGTDACLQRVIDLCNEARTTFSIGRARDPHYDEEGFLRTARHEGAVAARMGKPVDACPYAPSDADPARSWLEGHAGAKEESA